MKFCPPALWESLARADASATFFQTPAWHAIAARHFGAQTAPLLFEFAGKPHVVACLPLLRDKRWGRWRYFSPFGTYTALLCAHPLEASEIAQVQASLARLNLQLASSPFTQNPVSVGRVAHAHVHVVDLAHMNADDVMRDWSPDPRRKVRMAQDAGVTIRTGETDACWRDYLAVYLKSLQRWGDRATSRYPDALFADIRRSTAGAHRLWLAEHDGLVIAGFIAFYHNRHACIWHGASDPAHFKTGAVQLLYRTMIAAAARDGYAVFDLMGSGGTASLEAFKASLGTAVLEYETSLNRRGLVAALATWRERLRGGSRP
jgi:CelD/BcsL family acetyltransferase involved in cellulose biosynthesis